MKLVKHLIPMLLIALVFISCNSDPCGNTGTPIGKYIADTYTANTELYLIIKQDGTFVHHYKDRNGKVTEKMGKWNVSKTKLCAIDLEPWYCLGTQMPQEKLIYISATFEDDKIMPYIDVPIYRKE